MAPNMFSLEHKVTVVTGGARGIGFALARAAAEFGSNIALLDLSDTASKDLSALKDNTGVEWRYYRTNVTDYENLKQAFDGVIRDFGRIDSCIAAAGIGKDAPFFEHTWDACQNILNVNVMGSYFTAQLAAQHMINHGTGGSILLISSQTAYGTTPQEHTSMYGASKAAVKALAVHLGVELAPYKIRVNSLSPGYIETEMGRAALEANPKMKDVFEKAPPLGRRGQVTDLTGAAIWLLSEAGSWTTGSDVLITGGLHGGGMHLRV
ncbi:Nn.00g003360.m01.CDS01 [Neocucurbitaria sp. VM-36]